MVAVRHQEQIREPLNDWLDLWLSENKRAGFIALTNFERQWFYNSDEGLKLKSETVGRRDIYMSLNAFGYDSNRRLTRLTKQLKQIRNIAIDIDQYKLGLSIDDVKDTIHALVLDDSIPEPNLVLTSRGVQIFYTLHEGAAPEMAWLAGYITEQLVAKLDHIGADYNATDMSRVMRVPYTINSRNGAVVSPGIWNNTAYTLQELQAYCKPLTRKDYSENKLADVIQLPTGNVAQFHRTNWARKRDLLKLLELRNGDLTGCRNIYVYILAFQQTLIVQDGNYSKVQSSVSEVLKGMYTTDPTAEDSDNWFETTVKSAYEGAVGFLNHLKVNNYNVIYRMNDGIVKTMNTRKIIKKLNITEDEQREMGSLRSEKIKREQRAEYSRTYRRERGSVSREAYEKHRLSQKAELTQRIQKLKAEGMKQKEIAEALSISKSRVSQLLKELKENAI